MLTAGVYRNLGIERPEALAGCCVKRNDMIMRGAEIKTVLDLDWGNFECCLTRIERTLYVSRLEGPGDLQTGDIAFVDIRQCGKAAAIAVAPIKAPLIPRNCFSSS